MKIDSEKFISLVKEKGLDHKEIMQMAGLSDRVYSWILSHEYVEKRTLQRLAEIIGNSVADIMQPDPGDEGENVLEFRRNEKTALLTLCQGRYISRINELAKKYPKDCKVLAVNKDKSILAEIPTDWIRINPNVKLTEEESQKRSERMKKYHEECVKQQCFRG